MNKYAPVLFYCFFALFFIAIIGIQKQTKKIRELTAINLELKAEVEKLRSDAEAKSALDPSRPKVIENAPPE